MNSDTREVALREEPVKLRRAQSALHKDDHLIELKLIKEVVQLPVLLLLVELDVILLETVQGKLSLVVNVNLKRRLHELFADGADILGEGGREHHDLLLLRSCPEDLLDVATHV